MCLAHATATVARDEHIAVTLGHVRHNLRPDDDRDAGVVARLAEQFAISLIETSLMFDLPPHAWKDTENMLRHARYHALAGMARGGGADAVLTGHTLDDQAETVLLHLLRGSGLDGLGGMSPDTILRFDGAAMRVVRPLLALRRGDTQAYCAAHDLPYLTDPTNADTRYTRNWLRADVLPLLATRAPAVAPLLARSAALLRDDAALLDSLTTEALMRCTREETDTVAVLDRSALRAESVALQRRILRALVVRFTGNTPRAEHVEQMRHFAIIGNGTRPITRDGVMCWPVYGALIIGGGAHVPATVRTRTLARHPLARLLPPQPFAASYFFAPDPVAPQLSYRAIILAKDELSRRPLARDIANAPERLLPLRLDVGDERTLVLRNRQPGDRIHLPKARGSRTLQDYLTDLGVPAAFRDETPLLVCGERIVWVIGYDTMAPFAAVWEDATHFAFLARYDHDA